MNQVCTCVTLLLASAGSIACAQTIHVENGETLVVDNETMLADPDLMVGGVNSGQVEIVNAGQMLVAQNATIFEHFDMMTYDMYAPGLITVDGGGSLLDVGGELRSYRSFWGEVTTLNVINGGRVESNSGLADGWVFSGKGTTGSFGSLSIDTGAEESTAHMRVEQGAIVDVGPGGILMSQGRRASVLTANGSGSLVRTAGPVVMGDSGAKFPGAGRLVGESGGRIEVGDVTMTRGGMTSTGDGSEIVTGAVVNRGGPVRILDGGVVRTEGNYEAGPANDGFFSAHSFTVRDPGSLFDVNGDFIHNGNWVSFPGAVSMSVSDGGRVEVEGSFEFTNEFGISGGKIFRFDDGTMGVGGDADFGAPGLSEGFQLLEFRLNGGNTRGTSAILDVEGLLSFGTTSVIELVFEDAELLTGGEVFDLFDFGSVSGDLGYLINADGLLEGLTIDTSRVLVDGTVRVVPVPGTLAVLFVSGVAARRRR